MKKGRLILLTSFILCSCTSIEFYSYRAYEEGDIVDYYYTCDDFKDDIVTSYDSTVEFYPTSNDDSTSVNKYFNGYHELDLNPKKNSRLGEVLSNSSESVHKGLSSFGYNDILSYNDSILDVNTDWNINNAQNNDSLYVGKLFGRTKCMSTLDDSFKQGYLSKLYNGQMFCDGLHSKAFVCLTNEGFKTKLAKKITQSDYFLLSFRGGSDDKSYNNFTTPRINVLDLNINFYYEDNSSAISTRSFLLKDVYVETDNGGEACTFTGFKFSDLGIPSENIIGYGLSYTLKEDEKITKQVSYNNNDSSYVHWGLLLYEVMFINAEFN